jgi:enoyl-CoA hydratase
MSTTISRGWLAADVERLRAAITEEGLMDFASYKAISFRRDGRVLHATLNRPETLNSINGELEADLASLFDDVAKDEQTNVLVLSGAGRAFSAGGDIEQMQGDR